MPSHESRYVLTLLKKFPALVTEPIQTISKAWLAVDPAVASLVTLAEQQALNGVGALAPPTGGGGDGSSLITATSQHNFPMSIAHWAAKYGFVDVLKHLSSTDAGLLQRKDNFGNLPLHWAAKGGNEEALNFLLDAHRSGGVPILSLRGEGGKSVVDLAAGFGHVHLLRVLHDDPATEMLFREHSGSESALHLAARFGCWACIQFFDDRGYRLDALDKHGRTLVHYAAESGQPGILRELEKLSKWRPILSQADYHTATAMHYAVRSSRSHDAVELLHAADESMLTKIDDCGRSPAVWCVLGGKTERHLNSLRFIYANAGGAAAFMPWNGTSFGDLVGSVHGVHCKMYAMIGQMVGVVGQKKVAV